MAEAIGSVENQNFEIVCSTFNFLFLLSYFSFSLLSKANYKRELFCFCKLYACLVDVLKSVYSYVAHKVDMKSVTIV